jgi:riboflavin biosynthesis pyrimidine reductase
VTVVGGPSVIQELLRAGLVDELQLDVMPVILGTDLRLLDDPDLSLRIEKLRLQEIGPRTSLRFRVR